MDRDVSGLGPGLEPLQDFLDCLELGIAQGVLESTLDVEEERLLFIG